MAKRWFESDGGKRELNLPKDMKIFLNLPTKKNLIAWINYQKLKLTTMKHYFHLPSHPA
jgi:hypothetical protein